MPKYLVTASYTAEGTRGLMKDGGTKRVQVVRELLREAGATLESLYFALGDHDVYIVFDAPDAVAVTAIALATNSTGAVRVNTTMLLTPEEVDAAAKRTVHYTPPGR
jgi:uncharacterized protein with GYD domain